MNFDTDLAKLTVKLCRIAYRAEDAVRTDAANAGLSEIRVYDGWSTQAFTGLAAGTFFIAFRGSEAIADWLANARFLPSDKEEGVRVHSGFLIALDEVWNDMVSRVPATTPAVLTGHSLGAALAAIAAWRLARTGSQINAVYSYGQPRTGHGDFRAAYDALLGDVTHRFINHIDLVTRVPLLLQGYRHVGRRVYFDADGRAHFDARALQIAQDDVAFRVRHFGRIDSVGIAPHLIGPYQQLVDGL